MFVFKVLVAIAAAYVIWRIGFAMLRMLATPQAEPPPPGELRKVRMTYRCDICGAEVQMKLSPTQDPEPPRHCMEDMRMVTPIEDL